MFWSWHLVTRLPVQAGCGDIAGPIMAAGGEQDEVTGESLVLPHHNDVPNLTEVDSHITHPRNVFPTSIMNGENVVLRFT